MNEQEQAILTYLENAYTGARMSDDVDAMVRIARAIEAFSKDAALECVELAEEEPPKKYGEESNGS